MKTKFTNAFIFGMIMNVTMSSAQVSTGFNFGVSGNYVGWDGLQAFPLIIKHEAQQPINFHTFAGAGSLNNLRMFIEGNTGRVGIGNFAIANTILHVHESAANTEAEISISNNATGNTTLDGFRIGSFTDNSVLFRLYEDARIDFGTNITNTTNNKMRFRIYHGTVPGNTEVVGRLGIAERNTNWGTNAPLALLHMGEGWTSGAGGHRPWMDVGVFQNCATDMMYIGLKNEQNFPTVLRSDHMDAIIGWGDNQTLVDNFNDLRFIFTSPTALGGVPGSADGRETMRLSWNGNVGVGNFYDPSNPLNPIRPARRLEVLDGGLNAPQLRLTHTQQNGINTGSFVDMMTTNLGNLFIDPWYFGNSTNVGIGTQSPTAKLTVRAQTLSSTGNITAQKIESSQTLAGTNTGLDITIDGANSALLGETLTLTGAAASSMGIFLNQSSFSSGGIGHGMYSLLSGANKENYAFRTYVSGSANVNFGVYSISDNAAINYGGYFGAKEERDNTINYGVSAEIKLSSSVTNYSGIENYALKGYASALEQFNVGVMGHALGGGVNYGVWGIASQGNCSNSSCTDAAGFFQGDIFYSGNEYTSSDQKFKINIQDFTDATQILSQLQPKTYEFDTTNFNDYGLSGGINYGLIAQDVEKVLPTFIKEFVKPALRDSAGNIIKQSDTFKAINYNGLIPILLQAINEQQKRLDSLTILLTSTMQNRGVQSTLQPTSPSEKVKLSFNQGLILKQNDPNPFSENTLIAFEIPAEVQHAKIIFSTASGVIVKEVELISRGIGQIEVYGTELGNGIYVYSLICDDILIETKKMIKQ